MLFCCLKKFSSNSLLSQFPFILHLIILYSFKFKSTLLKLPTCFHISQSISYLHQNKFICSISFLIELLFIFHIPSALHIALNKILQNIRLHLIKFFIKLSFLFPISSNCDALAKLPFQFLILHISICCHSQPFGAQQKSNLWNCS